MRANGRSGGRVGLSWTSFRAVSKLQESGGPNQRGVARTASWNRPADQGPKDLWRPQNVVAFSLGNDRSLEREPQLEEIYAFVSRHPPQVRTSQDVLIDKPARQVIRGFRRMNTQWHHFRNNLIRKRDVAGRLALFYSRTRDRADAGEDVVCKLPIQVPFGFRQQVDNLVAVGQQTSARNVLLLCRACKDTHLSQVVADRDRVEIIRQIVQALRAAANGLQQQQPFLIDDGVFAVVPLHADAGRENPDDGHQRKGNDARSEERRVGK